MALHIYKTIVVRLVLPNTSNVFVANEHRRERWLVDSVPIMQQPTSTSSFLVISLMVLGLVGPPDELFLCCVYTKW